MQLNLFNQRWKDRRDSYRPAEPINPRLYEVAELPGDNEAKAFVLAHHYSGSFPAARFRYGLYRSIALVGVAVFSVPMHPGVITSAFKGMTPQDGIELGRFVLLDDVPGNGETWFLSRCFSLLTREDVRGVVSFSDPEKRTTSEGVEVFGGHFGTIYQSFNGVHLGRANPKTERLLPDGSLLSGRAIAKLNARIAGKSDKVCRGWRYVVDLLERFGAPAPGSDLRTWRDEWVPQITRKRRHPGNFKYAWGLTRTARGLLPEPQPYPKKRMVA
jgi:hypothetical protein